MGLSAPFLVLPVSLALRASLLPDLPLVLAVPLAPLLVLSGPLALRVVLPVPLAPRLVLSARRLVLRVILSVPLARRLVLSARRWVLRVILSALPDEGRETMKLVETERPLEIGRAEIVP